MSVRLKKISALIQEELSLIFLHKVQDPELGLVTITNVKVTPDLKIAKVYISILDKSKREYVMNHIESLKGFLRTELAHRVRIKNTPELNFYLDDTLDYVEKMEELFNKIRKDDSKEHN